MEKREIKACVGRIEWVDAAHKWLEAPTSHAVMHTSYEGGEPQSGEWFGGLPATAYPSPVPRSRLHLPNLLFTYPTLGDEVPTLRVQLWELRDGVMWHWVFAEWRPGPSDGGGTEGALTASRAWQFERTGAIIPV